MKYEQNGGVISIPGAIFSDYTERTVDEAVVRVIPHQKDLVFVSLPWSDLINEAESCQHPQESLMQQLDSLATILQRFDRVLSVCVHPKFSHYLDVFREVGVTDLYCAYLPIASLEGYATSLGGGFTPIDGNKRKVRLFGFPLGTFLPTVMFNRVKEKTNLVAYASEPALTTTDHDAKTRVRNAELQAAIRSATFTVIPELNPSNLNVFWQALNAGSIPVLAEVPQGLPGITPLWQQGLGITPLLSTLNYDKLALEKELQTWQGDALRLAAMRNALAQQQLLYCEGSLIADVISHSHYLYDCYQSAYFQSLRNNLSQLRQAMSPNRWVVTVIKQLSELDDDALRWLAATKVFGEFKVSLHASEYVGLYEEVVAKRLLLK